MRYLDQALEAYGKSDVYPFHMPGHKRNPLPFPEVYGIDITEIDGFDNLHHAEGILKGHSSVRLISTVLHIVIILSMAAPAGFLHQSVQQ